MGHTNCSRGAIAENSHFPFAGLHDKARAALSIIKCKEVSGLSGRTPIVERAQANQRVVQILLKFVLPQFVTRHEISIHTGIACRQSVFRFDPHAGLLRPLKLIIATVVHILERSDALIICVLKILRERLNIPVLHGSVHLLPLLRCKVRSSYHVCADFTLGVDDPIAVIVELIAQALAIVSRVLVSIGGKRVIRATRQPRR